MPDPGTGKLLVRTPEGKLHEYTQAEVDDALAKGEWWGYEQAPDVNMVDPSTGRAVSVKFEPESVLRARKEGFRFQTGEEVTQQVRQEEYGGTGGEIVSGLLGFGRGVSVGLLDPVLTQTGLMSPQALEAYREVNPTTSMVSEGVGAVVPALASGGATLGEQAGAQVVKAGVKQAVKAGAKKALAASPAGLLNRASVAAERAIAERLGGGVGAKVAGATIAQAGEGSVWALGQAISEAAIQDEPLKAEQLVAGMGFGALVGGGAGGALRGVGELAGAGVRRGKRVFDKLKTADPETGAPGFLAKAAGKITGRDPTRLQKWLDNTAEARKMREIATLDLDEVRSGLAREMSEALERGDQKSVIELADSIFEHTKSLKPQHIREFVAPGTEQKILERYDDLMNRIQGTGHARGMPSAVDERGIIDMLEEGAGTYGDRVGLQRLLEIAKSRDRRIDIALAKVDDPGSMPGVVEEIVNKDLAARVFNHMDNLKRDIGKMAKKIGRKRSLLQSDVATFEWYRQRYEEVRRFLEDDTLFGEMAKKQAAINDLWTEYLEDTGYRMRARLETKVGQKTDPDKAFEARFGTDPGAHKRFIDKLGDVENDLDHGFWVRRMRNRAKLARAHGELYELPASDMMRIEQIEQATARWFKKLEEAEFKVGLQKEFQAISKAGIGREAVIGMGAAGYVLGGPIGAAAGAILPGLLDPAKMIHTRAVLDRIGMVSSVSGSVARGFERGAQKFLEATGPIKAAVRAGTVPASVRAFVPRTGEPLDDGDHQEAFRRVKEDLQTALDNPAILQQRLERRLADINEQLPGVATHMAIAAARAASYLLETAPKPLAPQSPIAAMSGDDQDVPDYELARWWDRYETVNDPSRAADHLADGTLTREEVETIQAVYPRLYQELLGQITKAVAEGKKLTYSQKIRLSYLTGKPMDPSLEPQMVARLQNTYTQMRAATAVADESGKKKRGRKMSDKAKQRLAGAHESAFQAVEREASA